MHISAVEKGKEDQGIRVGVSTEGLAEKVVFQQTRRKERVSHEAVHGKAFQAEGRTNAKIRVHSAHSKETPRGLCSWSTERSDFTRLLVLL